jgi:hypothetical protein
MKKILFTLFFLASSNIFAQGFTEILSEFTSTGHAGTDFYLTFHPCYEYPDYDNKIRIHVASTYKTTVTLEIPGLGTAKQKMTNPNNIIQFDLEINEGVMHSKGFSDPPEPARVWEKRAIHLYSEYPVVVYAILVNKWGADGYLALPTNVLGRNYIVSSWVDNTLSTRYEPSYTSIIAAHDNTEVTFRLGGNRDHHVPLPDDDEMVYSQAIKKEMNKGDVFLIPGAGYKNDLTGSTISATRPVAVVSGNYCGAVFGNCSYLAEMETPVESWGEKYFVTPIFKRVNSSIIKIFPKEPGTEIYMNDVLIAKLNAVGGMEGDGYLEVRAFEGENRPVCISGDKPINVVQYNTGIEFPEKTEDLPLTPPFQMSVLPVRAYHNTLYWSTPNGPENYFWYKYINVVFLSDVHGEIPEDMQFGEVTGTDVEWTRVKQLVEPDSIKSFGIIDKNTNRVWKCFTMQLEKYYGVYGLRAINDFAVYSYGMEKIDEYNKMTYGMPAGGMFLKPENNNKDIDSLAPQVTEIENDSIIFKFSVNDKFSDPYSSGLMQIIGRNLENCILYVGDFEPIKDTKAEFEIEITEPFLEPRGEVVIRDFEGNTNVYKFEYNHLLGYPEISISDESVSEQFNIYYSPYNKEIKIKNEENFFSSRITGIRLEGDTKNVSLEGDYSEEEILIPRADLDLNIRFTPDKPQKVEFDLIIEHSNLPDSVIKTHFSLEAVNTEIKVTDVNFFNVLENETKPGIMTVSNTAGYRVNVTGVMIEDESHFVLEDESQAIFGLEPGKSKDIVILFTPDGQGDFMTTAQISSDAYSGDSTAVLSGNGIIKSAIENDLPELITAIFLEDKLSFKTSVDLISKEIKIRSLNGELIYRSEKPFSIGNTSIKIPGLASGVYFVEMKITGKPLTLKFIK